MGSRAKSVSLTDPSGNIDLVIKGQSLKNSNSNASKLQMCLTCNFPDPNQNGSFKQPRFVVKNNINKNINEPPTWKSLYKSSVVNNITGEFKFPNVTVPFQILCADDKNKQILFEFYDFHQKVLIGTIVTSAAALLSSTRLTLSLMQGPPNNNEVLPYYSVTFDCKEVSDYKFLDFLEGGLKLNLVIAIDYTKSNNEQGPGMPSLHDISTHNLNS